MSTTDSLQPATLLRRLDAGGRLAAFGIHIAASVAVVGCIGGLMLWLWFPQPWFIHDGGWWVYQIILAVDVVLGPLLTLIVFRRGKPGLRRDMTFIIALQLGALAYGASTMYQYRPAFVVYGEGNLFTVTWNEVRRGTKDVDRLAQFTPARGPGFVMLRTPTNPKERLVFRTLRTSDGPSIVSRGDYYDHMTDADWQDLFTRGPSLEDLARQDPAIREDVERFKARNSRPMEQLGFVAVVCRREVIMLIFDRSTRTIIDWLS